VHKLDGETLLGFGDFFDDALGAGAKKPGAGKSPPTGKGKPGASRAYPKVRFNPAIRGHGRVLTAGRKTAARAAGVLAQAAKLLRRRVPGVVHVGAAAAKVMSPQQKLAVARSNAAAKKAAALAKPLAAAALRTKAAVQMLAKHLVAQKRLVNKMKTGHGRRVGRPGAPGAKRSSSPAKRPVAAARGRSLLGELLDDPVMGDELVGMLREYYTEIGAEPDPNNPGYLTDGSPDPAFAGEGGDAGAPPADDASLSDLAGEDPLDTGAELPPPPGMDVFIRDASAVGGIVYDGSKGTPDGFVLSYGLATRKTDQSIEPDTAQIDGNEHWGYVFGRYDKSDPPNGGIPWGSNLAPGQWNHVHGRFWLGRGGWWDPVAASEAFTSPTKRNKYGREYGPLVGNPAMPDFAAMRVDGNGVMFWFPQEAPDWLTFPIKQAAALSAQAAQKAKQEADKAAAEAEAKARADEAAAKAAQDAANALAESASATEQKVQEARQQTEAQQAILEEQKLDTEQQRAAGDIMLRQAQRAEEYYKAHPDEEFRAPPPGEEPEPGEEGEEEGGYEDAGAGGDEEGEYAEE
jgi:hypothetical protein